jgi:hypothetical protein
MTRLPTIALLAMSACTLRAGGDVWTGDTDRGLLLYARPNVDTARELDQEGVKSFGESRYADALAYFRSARALGGPASELWNIARCLEHLDDPEGAARTLDEYLSQHDLPAADRAEAQREAQAVRTRTSVLTVTTSPAGATVTVDGQPLGPTPVTTELRPGAHTLVVRRAGYVARTVPVDARFGRAVIVALDLDTVRK